jgi:uncharacterized YccA/Bax inhibitor family protein
MSNPAIDRVIGEYAMQSQGAPLSTKPVTLDLVVQRTVISGTVLGIGVASGWFMGVSWGAGMAILFALTGMGLAFANIFMKPIRPILVLAFALVQGLFVGVLSNSLNSMYPGIAQQALLGASVAFGTMLVLYSMRIVRGGAKFMRILFISTISYGVFALISFISSFFGVGDGWGLYGGSFGLLFAGIGVVLATISFIADFSAIEDAVTLGVDERESWRLAFGLMVTFIWLYVELLRLLAILNRR